MLDQIPVPQADLCAQRGEARRACRLCVRQPGSLVVSEHAVPKGSIVYCSVSTRKRRLRSDMSSINIS